MIFIISSCKVFFLKSDTNIFALNNNTKTALEVTYPIEINGEKIDIKAYNIDGRTYGCSPLYT